MGRKGAEHLDELRVGLAETAGERGSGRALTQATAALGLRNLPGGMGRAAGAPPGRAPRIRP